MNLYVENVTFMVFVIMKIVFLQLVAIVYSCCDKFSKTYKQFKHV